MRQINVNPDTHVKLVVFKSVCGYKTFDETINDLIETHPRYAEVKREL